MSTPVARSQDLSHVYGTNAQGRPCVLRSEITTDNRSAIVGQIAKAAIESLIKALANGVALAITSLGALTVGYIAFKITAFITGVFVLPLAIIPPLYKATTTIVALPVGLGVSYWGIRKHGQQFFELMKARFNDSVHFSKEVDIVRKYQI